MPLFSVSRARQLNAVVGFHVVHFLGASVPIVWMPHCHKALRPLVLTLLLGLPMVVELNDPATAATSFALGVVSLFLLALTVLTDPGILPPAIDPDRESTRQKLSVFLRSESYKHDLSTGSYCRTCCHVRARRSSHCRLCQLCVTEHDHHCFVLGCCIGARNLRWFLAYMLATTTAGAFTSVQLLRQTVDLIQRGRLSTESAVAPALSVGITSCFSIVVLFFTLRIYYVIIVAGGTTRFGVSGGTAAATAVEKAAPGFGERMCAIVWPAVPSMLLEYAAALDDSEASRVEVVSTSQHDEEDRQPDEPSHVPGGRYMTSADSAVTAAIRQTRHSRVGSKLSASASPVHSRHDSVEMFESSGAESQRLVTSV